jgi:hypothetical protein
VRCAYTADDVTGYAPIPPACDTFERVERESARKQGRVMEIRNIPRDLMKKVKIAAAVEGKSIKALLFEA